ncbi:MAG: hypothetical protein IK127_04025 [Clostridia bacterium]|nr:hypothetical protein [Clostridia bacterium]
MLASSERKNLDFLTDEEFFARRFTLSEEDQDTLLRNSVVVDGRRFFRASVRDSILRRYAAKTNPKPGEPGSRENPLYRSGKAYVYNSTGDLVEYAGQNVHFSLRQDMKPTDEQKHMIREASRKPIHYSADCPEIPEQRLATRMRPIHP